MSRSVRRSSRKQNPISQQETQLEEEELQVDAEMKERLDVMETASLQKDTLQGIIRASKDNICVSSLASHFNVEPAVVEAALWEPGLKSVNSFGLFCVEKRADPDCKAQLKGLPMQEQQRHLAQSWATTSPAKRAQFSQQAAIHNNMRKERMEMYLQAREQCMQRTARALMREQERAREEAQKQAAAKAKARQEKLDAAAELRKQQSPKKQSAPEVARLNNNRLIKEARAAADIRAQAYLHRNWEYIEPFTSQLGRKAVPKPAMPPKSQVDVPPTASKAWSQLPLTRQPAALRNCVMRDYQLVGLNWLIDKYRSGVSAILGDEMGLGKTIQTISLITWLTFQAHVGGPHLVLVPLSVLSNWISEFKRFSPKLRVLRVHTGDQAERDRLRKQVQDVRAYDVVVTTYDMVKTKDMRGAFTRTYWRMVVLDEGHIIKNEETIISQQVRRLHMERALLLTGTPLQNNLHELWAVLNFLLPKVFTDQTVEAFDKAFAISGNEHKVDEALLLKAHDMLQCFMLRRLKRDVEKGIPAKVETQINCPLSELQQTWYKRLLLAERDILADMEHEMQRMEQQGDSAGAQELVSGSSSSSEWRRLHHLLMQLRKVCNHPYMFDGVEEMHRSEVSRSGPRLGPASQEPPKTDDHLVRASGKMHTLDRLLTRLRDRGHRVVVFSQFTSMLDILEDYLTYRFGEDKIVRLDGSTNRVQRNVNIRAFNAPGSPLFAFIMSTRAGGLGVNLQTADTVVLYDSDWNPQADLQAMARVHRIGQTRPVAVYRLVTAGSVEERIVQRAQKKLYLDQMVNRDSATLLATLKFGAHCILGSDQEEMPNSELESLIAVRPAPAGDKNRAVSSSSSKSGKAAKPLMFRQMSAAEFNPEMQTTGCRDWQGVYHKPKEQSNDSFNMNGVEQLLANPQKRRRTSRLMTDEFTGQAVLRINNYTMEEGEPSIVAGKTTGKPGKGARQTAGIDYENEEHCLQCWEGGDLILCDHCPASYHKKCLGVDVTESNKHISWSCPQHSCVDCGRKAAACGGMLFRCWSCPRAFCEDCLPVDPPPQIVHRNLRFEALGCRQQKQACFIYCQEVCADWGSSQELGPAAMGRPVESILAGEDKTASEDEENKHSDDDAPSTPSSPVEEDSSVAGPAVSPSSAADETTSQTRPRKKLKTSASSSSLASAASGSTSPAPVEVEAQSFASLFTALTGTKYLAKHERLFGGQLDEMCRRCGGFHKEERCSLKIGDEKLDRSVRQRLEVEQQREQQALEALLGRLDPRTPTERTREEILWTLRGDYWDSAWDLEYTSNSKHNEKQRAALDNPNHAPLPVTCCIDTTSTQGSKVFAHLRRLPKFLTVLEELHTEGLIGVRSAPTAVTFKGVTTGWIFSFTFKGVTTGWIFSIPQKSAHTLRQCWRQIDRSYRTRRQAMTNALRDRLLELLADPVAFHRKHRTSLSPAVNPGLYGKFGNQEGVPIAKLRLWLASSLKGIIDPERKKLLDEAIFGLIASGQLQETAKGVVLTSMAATSTEEMARPIFGVCESASPTSSKLPSEVISIS
eukprot:g56409.t1